MHRVMSAFWSRRSRVRACAAAFLAVAQFAVVSLAPTIEGRAGASAPEHVEDFGVHLHFAHNPDDCAACVATSLLIVAPPAPAVFGADAPAAAAFRAANVAAPERELWRQDAARAPPPATGARSLS